MTGFYVYIAIISLLATVACPICAVVSLVAAFDRTLKWRQAIPLAVLLLVIGAGFACAFSWANSHISSPRQEGK